MAWIEVHDTISGHRKTYRLASNLQIPQYSAVGILVSLWTWALDNAEDGSLCEFPSNAIARACFWDGDPSVLVEALIESGWIDEDMSLHDWYDYAGRLIEFRKKERTRLKQYRSRTKQVRTSTIHSTDAVEYNATVPNQTVPNQTKPAVSRIDDKSALLTESEMDAMREQQALMNECYDLAESIGLKSSSDRMKCDGCAADYSAEWLIEALKRTANVAPDKRNWNYIIKGMLDKWKAAERIDDGQKPKAHVPRRVE